MASSATSTLSAPYAPSAKATALCRPYSVMLLIGSLEHGGAERQIIELMRNFDRTRVNPFVCSLSSIVPLAELLPDRARELVIVEKRWKYDFSTIPRLARVIRERRVDLIHAFLFDAEMSGRIAGRLAGRPVLISSERNTDYKRRWVHAVGLKLTRQWSDGLIANSNAGKRFTERTQGLPPERIHVIRNGVDVERFKPSDGARVRREFGLTANTPLIGMVAAFKTQKRHGDFFQFAVRLREQFPAARFLLVGEPLRDNISGAEDYHREVMRVADELKIRESCIFAGKRNDMPDVYSACNLTMLTSSREGTPNVLLESMACGVPVIATDVADNREIVPSGRAGYIVKLSDIDAMLLHATEILQSPQRAAQLGAAAREWAIATFSTQALARQTEDVYEQYLERKRAPRNE